MAFSPVLFFGTPSVGLRTPLSCVLFSFVDCHLQHPLDQIIYFISSIAKSTAFPEGVLKTFFAKAFSWSIQAEIFFYFPVVYEHEIVVFYFSSPVSFAALKIFPSLADQLIEGILIDLSPGYKILCRLQHALIKRGAIKHTAVICFVKAEHVQRVCYIRLYSDESL